MAVHASRDDARSRPGARQRHHDVLPGPIDLNDGAEEAFRDNQRQGLWAPGVAGAMYERCLNKTHENDGPAHGRGRRRGDRQP